MIVTALKRASHAEKTKDTDDGENEEGAGEGMFPGAPAEKVDDSDVHSGLDAPEEGSVPPRTNSRTTFADRNNNPAQALADSENATNSEMLECPPKDFSKGETGLQRRRTTKGTLQIMSPCGAKVFFTEMVYSESLSVMFHSLSTFIPIIQPRLRQIRMTKFADKSARYINPKSKRPGTDSTRDRESSIHMLMRKHFTTWIQRNVLAL
jgi:hypothetical protein